MHMQAPCAQCQMHQAPLTRQMLHTGPQLLPSRSQLARTSLRTRLSHHRRRSKLCTAALHGDDWSTSPDAYVTLVS